MISYGSRRPEIGLASVVIVGPGKDTGSLTFRYFPGATLSGRVLDETGEPIEDALVQLARSSVVDGKLVTKAYVSTRADDTGHYRFGRLPGGGSYFITVTGQPWYTKVTVAGVDASAPSPAFWPAYYPNTHDPSRAQPLVLKPGEERGADFVLRAATGASLTVKYTAEAPTFSGVLTLKYQGVANNDAVQRSVSITRAAGEYKLDGVPPGRYTVEVAGNFGPNALGASEVVDMNGAPASVALAPLPWPRVSGQVTAQRPDARLDDGIAVTLMFDDVRQVRVPVGKDGKFAFEPVPPGLYKLGLSSSRSAYLAGFGVTGTVLQEGDLKLSSGETPTLTIIASDEAGQVSGFVMEGGKATDGVLVVLAPEDPESPRQRYFGFQTESDGSFVWNAVPAGRYHLFAVEDTAFEHKNPAVVAPYRAKAKLVVVGPGSKLTEQLSVTPPPK